MSYRIKKKKIEEAGGALLTRRKTVLRMVIEKFKFEIENYTLEKAMLLTARKNITLQMENLKMKEEILKQEISALEKKMLMRNESSSIDEKDKLYKNKCRKMKSSNIEQICKTYNPPIQCKIEKESNPASTETSPSKYENAAAKEQNTTENSPFIVLLASNSKTFEENNLRKIYIDKLSEIDIQEYFQIECENPFKMVPLNKDVPLKIEDLKKLEPLILKLATNNSKFIPKLSLYPNVKSSDTECREKSLVKVENGDVSYSINMNSNVIDLTDGNLDGGDCISNKLKKRKPSDDSNISNKSRKKMNTPKVCECSEVSNISMKSDASLLNDNQSPQKKDIFENITQAQNGLPENNDYNYFVVIKDNVIEIS